MHKKIFSRKKFFSENVCLRRKFDLRLKKTKKIFGQIFKVTVAAKKFQ